MPNTLSDKQFKELLEAVTASRTPAPAPAQPLTLTSGYLSKLSNDGLAVLSAEAWSAYSGGDDMRPVSPFWRA